MAEKLKELQVVLEGNAEFAKNLYAVLSRSSGNVFFSPISIHAILSLMYQGATGHTKEALSKALNVSDEKIAALGYKEVMTRLNNAENVILHMANKIFVQETYGLQESFQRVAKEQFLSEVDLLNFKEASAAAKSINSWVENKTNNKIKDVFKPSDISGDSALVLVNAIYFKSKWRQPFNACFTNTMEFYLNDNDTIDVRMMFIDNKTFNYKYDEELAAQVVELPYKNDKFCMIVILPRERNGIAELEEKLAKTDLTKMTENMSGKKLRVGLPKFKIEQTIDLQDALTQLGLGVIFTQDAELPGLVKSSQSLYVGKAVQKTFIEINEEGTEAGACTGFACPCSLSYPETFTADHPFVIILAANQEDSRSFLFQGRVSKPEIPPEAPIPSLY